MQEFNREDLQQYFNSDYQGSESFFQDILIPLFGEDNVFAEYGDLCEEDEAIREQAAKANILSIKRFAQVTAMGLIVNVFDVSLYDSCRIQNSRQGIQQLVRQYVQHFDGALMLFHYQNTNDRSWRLSYMEKRSSNTDSTSSKRYTYLCGRDFSCRTLAERILLLKNSEKTAQDFERAFSVEALTLEFYKKLFRWYMWAVDERTGVTFPNRTETDTDDREDIQRKMIRLITRLLFVWFIKQKHLVPSNLFEEDELKKVLRDFDPQAKDSGNYYNAILQNLFFATLNQEINDRRFVEDREFQGKSDNYGDKVLYRDNKKQSWFTFPEAEKKERIMELFHSIPYLNGGLFECLDKFDLDKESGKYIPIKYYDGFSVKETKSPNGNLKYRAFIPNVLFFAPEHKELVDMGGEERENIDVCGLIEIFRQYNFTTEENTSTDAEVSLDPELLGKVFENLLAAYNPETKDSVRKSTGSYYTPREIVDYMVDESLIAYLTEQCGHDANVIRTLFANEKAPVPANSKKIADDLRAVKVLDPACGSGAFPMGILIRVTNLIEHLEPEGFNRYDTKLLLIKNCIFGIDIQPIAMLICKLRFFISLICDSEYRPGDPERNYGIIPLPNLETKFVAANSLLPAKLHEFDEEINNDLLGEPELKRMQQELLSLRKGIFDLHTPREKRANRRADYKLCGEISDYIKHTALQPNREKIAQCEASIVENEELLKAYQGKRLQKIVSKNLFGEETTEYIDLNKQKRDELQARIRTCQADIKKEENKSVPQGFTEAVEQVTLWNPYDQNTFAPFFDALWMFGIKDGFDIVIGNPPYVVTSKKDYPQYDWNSDLYKMFFERGIKSFMKEDGFICYITPKFYMLNLDDENMRDYFMKNMRIEFLSYCNPFEVITENVITLMTHDKTPQEHVRVYRENERLKVFEEDIPLSISYSLTNLHKEWITGIDSNILAVLTKMNWQTKLKNISISKRGAEISKKDMRATATGIQALIGQDMHKYSINWSNTYLDRNHREYRRLNTFFSKEMIYLRRVDVCLEATISDVLYGFNKNVYGIKVDESKGYKVKFILALINSKALDFYYKKKFSTKKEDVFPEIQTYLYEQLPVPSATSEQQQPIIDLVDKILAAKKQDTPADTTALEQKIDELVYKLYDLSDEEIKLIEQ